MCQTQQTKVEREIRRKVRSSGDRILGHTANNCMTVIVQDGALSESGHVMHEENFSGAGSF